MQNKEQIALIINGWTNNNKKYYFAITRYQEKRNGIYNSIILDIIKIKNAIYNRKYLYKKLLVVIKRLNIICFIIFVTRNNARPNDFMLNDFENAILAK